MPVLLSYRNQLIDLHSKSTDWFLYEGNTGTYSHPSSFTDFRLSVLIMIGIGKIFVRRSYLFENICQIKISKSSTDQRSVYWTSGKLRILLWIFSNVWVIHQVFAFKLKVVYIILLKRLLLQGKFHLNDNPVLFSHASCFICY